ncbi:MAG: lysylphosphatidylglycerol synthase domain-containing protein [Tahibacter sp.]
MTDTVDFWQSSFRLGYALFLTGGCFVVTLAHFLMEPLRWNTCYLARERDAPTRAGVRDALFSTALASYILPFKLGIPLRFFLLRRTAGFSAHFLGVVVALDGIVSLVAWTSLTAVAAYLSALQWNPPWYLWVGTVAAGVIFCALLIARRSLASRWLAGLTDALATFDRPWNRILRSSAIVCVDVISYGVRHAGLLLLVSGESRHLFVGGSIGIVATFAGIISGLPMGLLGYDAALVGLLTLSGVKLEHALLVALVNRVLNLLAAAVLGIPAAMRLGIGSSIGVIIAKFREIGNGKI